MRRAHGILSLLVLVAVGCATSPETKKGRESLVDQARVALESMQRSDPSLRQKLNDSYAYAVFPSVGEGGFIVGGTYGRGVVFRDGRVVGYADIKEAKVGALAGGQTYDELILFQDREAYRRLVNQGLSFEASASATALKSGVAGSTPFREGLAVFVRPKGGLMASVAIGGQSIDFVSTTAAAGRRGY